MATYAGRSLAKVGTHITLRGPLKRVHHLSKLDDSYEIAASTEDGLLVEFNRPCLDAENGYGTAELCSKIENVWLLRIKDSISLVLTQIEGYREVDKGITYKRLGLVQGVYTQWFSKCKAQVLVII
jgi:hypothetical protein